jgi:uncharacterized protein (UPF0276 family)
MTRCRQYFIMKLAINYSPQAAALVAGNALDIDLFKCPSPDDAAVRDHCPTLTDDAAALRPVYIHFPLNTCDGSIDDAPLARVAQLRAQTGTPYVNVHLVATCDDFPDLAMDDVRPETIARVTDHLIVDVARLANAFGAENVIAENVVYREQGSRYLAAAVLPDVIARVVEATGCGLLLDTAHARLSAHALNMPVRDYLEGLPLGSLRELHITGARLSGKPAADSMPMEEGDWEIADWAFERIRSGAWPAPWAVALEYGGVGPIFDWRSDPAVIAEQFPQLRALAL